MEFGGIRKKKEGKRGSKQEREKESDREKERERKGREKLKGGFTSIPMVETRRSEKKSRSTRELRVGIKILEFRQTPRGREFSYLDYF